MRKYHLNALLALVLCISLVLSGCHRLVEEDARELRVVASFYPIYVLASNVVKDVTDLTLNCLTQPQDGCLRSYQLSDWDAQVLTQNDAVIVGTRGLERFGDTLMTLESGPAVLAAMDGLTLINDGIHVEGDDGGSHVTQENPWLFLSIDGAQEMCASIAGGMAMFDPMYEGRYEENLDAVHARLGALKTQIAGELVGAAGIKFALLHEGLIYFAQEFGLDVAVQVEREPATCPEGVDLTDLIADIRESGAEVAIVESQAPVALIEALEGAGVRVVRFDTLTTHMADGDALAYDRIMLGNARGIAKVCS